nr:MAG TPA: hypothetical protein [Caudoviricetes sp.]
MRSEKNRSPGWGINLLCPYYPNMEIYYYSIFY